MKDRTIVARAGLPIARSLIFSVIFAGIYIILLLFSIPFNDTLGIVRVTITAFVSNLTEQGIYNVVKQSILLEEDVKDG